ncbi:hypothetical protein V8E55_005991 [Tylopilus felleus]
MALSNALNAWREAKTITVYGWANLRNHGPCLIMTNTTLERIINCSHHHKIKGVQDLKHETTWADAEEYGLEILELIKKHGAPLSTLFSSAPLRPLSLDHTNTSTSPTTHTMPRSTDIAPGSKHRNKCGACDREGHNGKSPLRHAPPRPFPLTLLNQHETLSVQTTLLSSHKTH